MTPGSPAPSGSEEPELKLSPSEGFAHDAAMRISGASHPDAGSAGPGRTQRALASIVLGFELIVVFLMGMTIFGLSLLDPAELGIWGGLALCGVILVALATMRLGRTGIVIGWAVHGLMLLSAVILPMSLIIGIAFTATWIYCMVKGSRIDRERAAWESAQPLD
ncbi:DUF4233 domain-containing protein [Leucobacter weissii]|uniref:DUF4233 domain-containing protein n=1 Tax=Leucobacter weissii TaxID=1983706 RepID=A0A939MMJ8_9MICO|nr:DUF4233 domain-containing protein [Leucobacter weissii]MBO1902625.1 DUF4233 domain-containing protein [Leucobacter weissii]